MKQLYEMTKTEYEQLHGKPRKNTTVTWGFSPHKEAIEIAINRGIMINYEVLRCYPELLILYPEQVEHAIQVSVWKNK